MDLSSIFSDDQIAVIGCFLALAVCGGIAGLSFRFGPANDTRNTSVRGVRFEQKATTNRSDQDRKAA